MSIFDKVDIVHTPMPLGPFGLRVRSSLSDLDLREAQALLNSLNGRVAPLMVSDDGPPTQQD